MASAEHLTAPLRADAAAVGQAGDIAAPAWRRNLELLNNAGTLVATTGLSAVLGFAFWAVAARLFSQQAIGYASATTSAMTFLGEIGMFGLGALLVTELPKRAARASLISAATLGAGIASLLVGIIFVLGAPHLSVTLRNSTGTLIGGMILIVGVVLTGVTFVFDQASIGLLRGALQLSRNFVFTAAKLLLLPAIAVTLHDPFGTGITLSWVAATAISAVVVAVWLRWKGSDLFAKPDWHALRGMARAVAAYNWLNIAATGPALLTPILVTITVSPSANGAFYAAWVMAGMLYIVPNHLSTVLAAVAANDVKALARRLRFTLMLSLLIGLPGMAALGLGGHWLLGIFGKGYVREATLPLSLLVLGYIPVVLRTHYTAICRSNGKISHAATFSALSAVAELAAIVLGARWDGLVGLSVAFVGVRCLTSALVTPTVLRAAAGRGRHRQGQQVTEARSATPMAHAVVATQTSQEAALAVLMLMSRSE